MKNKNICLIGFMAAGKTSISQKLGLLLNRDVVSTDDLIVKRENRAIVDIFKDSGESYFREVEKSVVKEASAMDNVIIDCGGGVVINQENIDNLKNRGILIYLEVSPEVIIERTKGDTNRPLLNVENPLERINGLLKERKEHYQKADYSINVDTKSVDQICQEVMKLL